MKQRAKEIPKDPNCELFLGYFVISCVSIRVGGYMNDLVLDCLAKLLLEYVPERICPIVEWLLLAEEYRQMGNSKSLHAFEGKVSVVTGAATGMGRQLALGLAKQGARGIALVDVHEEKLKEAASAISTAMGFPSPGVLTITTHVCDVSDRTQVFVTAADVASLHLGQIDALFNNAGTLSIGKKVPQASTGRRGTRTKDRFLWYLFVRPAVSRSFSEFS